MNHATLMPDWFVPPPGPGPGPYGSSAVAGSGGQWVYVIRPAVEATTTWKEKIVGVAVSWVKDTTRNSLAEMIGTRFIGGAGGGGGSFVLQWMATSLLRNYVIACLI